jgi:hypothetical protein
MDILLIYYQNVTQDIFTTDIINSLGYNIITFDPFNIIIRDEGLSDPRSPFYSLFQRMKLGQIWLARGVSRCFVLNIIFPILAIILVHFLYLGVKQACQVFGLKNGNSDSLLVNVILKIENFVNLNGIITVVKVFNPILVLHCGLGIFVGYDWFTVGCGCLWCVEFGVIVYFLVDVLAFSKDKETEMKNSIEKNLRRRDSVSGLQAGEGPRKGKRVSRKISELGSGGSENDGSLGIGVVERKKSIFSKLGVGLGRILRADSTASRFSRGRGVSKFETVKDNYGYFEDIDNCDPEIDGKSEIGPREGSEGSDDDGDYGYCYEYEISDSDSSHSEDSNGSIGENDIRSKSSEANSISDDSAEQNQTRSKGVIRDYACNQNREEFPVKTLPIKRNSGDSQQQSKTNDFPNLDSSSPEPDAPKGSDTPNTHFPNNHDPSHPKTFKTPLTPTPPAKQIPRKSTFNQPSQNPHKTLKPQNPKPRRLPTKPQNPQKKNLQINSSGKKWSTRGTKISSKKSAKNSKKLKLKLNLAALLFIRQYESIEGIVINPRLVLTYYHYTKEMNFLYLPLLEFICTFLIA